MNYMYILDFKLLQLVIEVVQMMMMMMMMIGIPISK
jgi:hypothetical protein